MMVGNNLKDVQLQQIVDKTIMYADKDGDGRISFEEFEAVSLSCFVHVCHLHSTSTQVIRLEGCDCQCCVVVVEIL